MLIFGKESGQCAARRAPYGIMRRMDDIRNALSFLPIAAVVAALVYLPFLLRLRKKEGYGILRHVFNYIFIGCVKMLMWVTLTGMAYQSLGEGVRSLNLRPFSEFAAVYMLDEGMYLSQPMLNIIMFVPFGLLLPIVFPKRMNRSYKTVAVILATTVLIEAIQYFIGRTSDIDDVIANLVGGVAGYSLYALLAAMLHKRDWFKRLLPSYSASRRRSLAAAGLVLASVFLLPAVLDIASARSEYGLLRQVTQTVPADALLNVAPSTQTPEAAAVFMEQSADARALADSLIETYFPNADLELTYRRNDYYGLCVYGASADGTVSLRVFEREGSYSISFPDGDDVCAMTDAALTEYASRFALRALEEGDSIVDTRTEEWGSGRSVIFSADSGSADAHISGSMTFYAGDGKLSFDYGLTRAVRIGETDVISEAEALNAARGISAFNYPCANIVIDSIELTTIERKGLLIPAYTFSGQADFEGRRIEWVSTVDAVARG